MSSTDDGEAAAPRTVTESLESDVDPDAAYAFAADPGRLPEWAPGFADRVTGNADSGWRVTKDGQEFAVRVAASGDARTVDFLREIAPGREGGAYLRVIPRPGGGSVISMTLPVPRGGDVAAVATIAGEELRGIARRAGRT